MGVAREPGWEMSKSCREEPGEEPGEAPGPGCSPGMSAAPPASAFPAKPRGQAAWPGETSSFYFFILWLLLECKALHFNHSEGQPPETLCCLTLSTWEDAVEILTHGSQWHRQEVLWDEIPGQEQG